MRNQTASSKEKLFPSTIPGKIRSLKCAFIALFVLVLCLGMSLNGVAATVTTTGSGNWSSTDANAPWPGGTIPASTDDIIIGNGFSLTVDGNRTCNSVSFTTAVSGTPTGTLSVNLSYILTVTTSLTAPGDKVTGNYLLSGAGAINCATLNCNNTTIPSGSAGTTITLVSTIANITISGNLILNGTHTVSGSEANNPVFNLQSGTVTVQGSVAFVFSASCIPGQNTSTITTVNGAQTGSLILSGATPFSSLNGIKGTMVTAFNGTGATVNYNRAAGGQALRSTTYRTLTMGNTSGTQTAEGAITATTLNNNISSACILNMGTNVLTVTTVNNIGTIQTQNTSATPVSSGVTWGSTTGTFKYNSTSPQTIVAGNYFNLDGTGGNRTLINGGTVGIAGAFTPGAGTYTITGNTVNFNGATTQSINGLTYNNLTISGAGLNSKTASNNITVNGILNLSSANASATQGALDMSTFTLNMGTTATTAGTGDVTGIVRRTFFALGPEYSFGNQFTTIKFDLGPLPTSLTYKIVLTAALPSWMNTTVGMNRYYDITRVGGSSATRLTLKLHYLDSELNLAPEISLDFFDNLVSGPNTVTDRGQNGRNDTDNWVSLTGLGLPYVANAAYDFRYWTLGTNNTGQTCTWISGGASLTDWTLPGNWNGGVPTPASDVVIPVITVTASTDNPTLPASILINTIHIQSGGVLNGGSGTSLTIAGSTNAWQNTGTFNAGSSTIVFTNAAATVTGTTNFNHVTINSGAGLTPALSNIMRIAGAFSNSGTLQARTNANTIEYNGTAQTVLNPNGTTAGYSNLILSGSGVKTMPVTALSIAGDFSMLGTASATALAAISTTGNFTIGSGTTFITGALQHTIKGNFLNSGTFTSSGSIIMLNGTIEQIVGGSVASTFNDLILNNSAGVTLNSVNPTVNGVLTFTNGKITTGSNTLILGNSASVGGAGAGKYIFGNLQKGIAASTTQKIFEIGNATNYLPTALNFTGVSVAGNITCSTADVQHPNYSTSGLSQTKYLNRYWTVTNSGVTFGTYDATFTFDSGDIVNSAAFASLLVKKYASGWTTPATGTNTATTVSTTGNTAFSDFVAGETSTSVTNYFRSNQTGNWSTPATWETSPDNSVWGPAGSAPTNAAASITITSGHTITVDATATASNLNINGILTSGSGIGLSVNGNWNNSGTFTASTGTVTFNGTTTISGTTNTFNHLTITGTLIGPASGTLNVTGNWSNNGTFTHNSCAVYFNGTSAQTVSGSSTFDHLTITKSSSGIGITAVANQTINGVLSLNGPNHSGTQGCLSMTDPNILFMGAAATTAGIGDVSGYINRSTFALGTSYTFGNQYTLMNFTTGPLPTSVTLEVYLTAAEPSWMDLNVGIWRYYDVIQNGGTPETRLRFNAHYLDSELHGAIEANLDLYDHHESGPYIGLTHDHGRTDNDATNNWVGFGNVGLVFLSTATAVDHHWTLGDRTAGDICTWIGGSPSGPTDWNLPGNWQGGVPLATSNVIIPTANYAPILPNGKTINSLNIQSGGILNATTGTPTLTIGGAAGWTNNGTFNAGTGSTVVFTHAGAAVNGETNFFNVTIAGTAALTTGTNSIMVIGGALTLLGTLNAATNSNTIEYKGTAQTVVAPNGSPTGYSSLILSGIGIKTMPISVLSILGNFSMSGSASATAQGVINITRDMILGSGTTFTAGAFTHSIGGNFSNSGTFTASGSTINFNGSLAQTISGATIFNALKINNAVGVTLAAALTVKDLTIGDVTSGSVLSDGGFPITGNGGTLTLSNSGTLKLGSGTSATAFPTFVTGYSLTSGTVEYGSTESQTIVARNYGNLTSSGNGARTLIGTIGIAGIFTPGGGVYVPGLSTIDFNGSSAQTIPAFTYYNLTISGEQRSGDVTFSSFGTIEVGYIFSPTANFLSGGFVNTGSTINFSKASDQIIPEFNYYNLSSANYNRELANSQTIRIGGAFTPGSGIYTIDGSTIEFNGIDPQIIPGFNFNNLIINNITGVSLNGSDATVNGTMTLKRGILATGSNMVIVGTAGTVTRDASNSYIDGNLRRYVPNTLAPVVGFDIGDAFSFTPVSVAFAGTVSGSGYLDASTVIAQPPTESGLSQTKYINRKWTITNSGVSGFTSYSPTFTFVEGDIVGAPNTSELAVRKLDSSIWAATTIGTRTATSTQCVGLTSFSDFEIGEMGIDHFEFSLTSPQQNGTAFTSTNTLTAKDVFNQTITSFDASADNVTIVADSPLTGSISGLSGTNKLTNAGDFTSGVANLTTLAMKYTGNTGTGTFTATSVSGKVGTSGSVTITAGAATKVLVETAADGSGTVVAAQSVASGSAITVYAITRDAFDNFAANVAATAWSLESITGGVVSGDLVVASDSKSAVFTGHAIGTSTIKATSASLTVTQSGSMSIVKADGPAAPGVGKTNVTAFGLGDGTLTGTSSGEEYQKDGGSWVSITGTTVTGLAPGSYIVRVAETSTTLAGTATAALVISQGAVSTLGGTVTISGTAKYGQVLTAVTTALTYTPTTNLDVPTYQWQRGGTNIGSATGSTYTLVLADIGSTITVAVTSDVTHATGNVTSSATATVTKAVGPAAPIESIIGTFPLAATSINLAALANSATGLEASVAIDGIVFASYADLVVSGAGTAIISGLYSVSTSTKVKIREKETATTVAGADKEIMVTPGIATRVLAETAANGSGTVVAAQNIASGSAITLYAITRDASDNFVANVAATSWSLESITGGVVSGDLVAASDRKSAVFTGRRIGVSTIKATSASLTVTQSGAITVIPGAATKGVLTTQPDGAVNGVAFTTQPVLQLQDASSNNVSTPGVNVFATIIAGTGVLGGTTTVTTDASGKSTFTDLRITGTAGNFTLSFTSASITAATFGSFALTSGLSGPDPITGNTTLCEGSTTQLYDATSSGSWSSTNSTVASVSAVGVVTGHSAGTANIIYTITNGVNTTSAAKEVTVNPTPVLIDPVPASRCDAGPLTLGVTASAGTVSWYAGMFGGSLLGTGTSFATPVITSTTTYYAEALSDGCVSARKAVAATINIPPSAPFVASVIQPTCSIPTGNVSLNGLPATGTWTLTLNPGNKTTNGTGISTTITSLPAGTYTFFVTSAEDCISPQSGIAVIHTQPVMLTAPVSILSTSLSQTWFTAAWETAATADGYRLDVATDIGFTQFVSGYRNKDVGNVSNYSVIGLTQKSTYFYRVRSYNVCGNSNFSLTIPVTTLDNPPVASVASPAENILQTSFTANWSTSATATGYRLDVSTDSGFHTFVAGYDNKDAGNVTTLNVTGLNADTTYFYRVRAINAGGPSPDSGTISLNTLPVPPDVPTAYSASGLIQIGFSARWSASPSAENYLLDVSADAGFTSYLAGYNGRNVGNVTSYSISGLNAMSSYYYRVRAYNTGGTNGHTNTVIAKTLSVPPNAPTGLVSSSCNDRVTLKWRKNADPYFLRYRIYAGTGNNPLALIDSTSASISDTSKIISGLTHGISYNFRVTAVNFDGPESPYSLPTTALVSRGLVPRIALKWNEVLVCYNLGDSIQNYQWNLGGSTIPGATGQFMETNKLSGTYTVVTSDQFGCKNSSNEIKVVYTKSLTLYPNPASVKFTLKLDGVIDGKAVISMFSATGVKVFEIQTENANEELIREIAVNNLDDGTYIVQVMVNQNELYNAKMTIRK